MDPEDSFSILLAIGREHEHWVFSSTWALPAMCTNRTGGRLPTLSTIGINSDKACARMQLREGCSRGVLLARGMQGACGNLYARCVQGGALDISRRRGGSERKLELWCAHNAHTTAAETGDGLLKCGQSSKGSRAIACNFEDFFHLARRVRELSHVTSKIFPSELHYR
eukprot:COSAG02_NODE_368_length_23727_cov_364.814367_9_plen_168_part_00